MTFYINHFNNQDRNKIKIPVGLNNLIFQCVGAKFFKKTCFSANWCLFFSKTGKASVSHENHSIPDLYGWYDIDNLKKQIKFLLLTLSEKCSYSELFWSIFSRIRTEYRETLRTCPYSVQMWENTDQNYSKYGSFFHAVLYLFKFNCF